MANVNNQPWVNYMSYLDPSYWQNAMQPAINQAATAFQPVASQPNPMAQNANLQALPGANPTAPRYTFDRSSLQTGFYDPSTRLNNFLQLLQQARSNLASPPENYVTPPASPLNAYNVNTPVPVSQVSLEPKKAAAPAPVATNNLMNNFQRFITVGGKQVPNPMPRAFLPGYNLSYKERK